MNAFEAGMISGMEKVAIRRSTAASAHEKALKRYDASNKSLVGMTDTEVRNSAAARRNTRQHAANLYEMIKDRDHGSSWGGRPQQAWSKEKPPVHVPRTPSSGMSRGAKAGLIGLGAVGTGLAARHILKKRKERKEREKVAADKKKWADIFDPQKLQDAVGKPSTWTKNDSTVSMKRPPSKAPMSGKMKGGLAAAAVGTVGAGLVARHVLKKRKERKAQQPGNNAVKAYSNGHGEGHA